MSRRFATSLMATLVVAALLAAGCGDQDQGSKPTGSRDARAGSSTRPTLVLREVGAFDKPVHALAVPGSDLVAVVEQGGRVVVASGMLCADAERCPRLPVDAGDVIVDLTDEVSSGSEQGLLGMAFHPRWPDDPRIFLDYTDRDGDTHVEAWTLASPTATARRSQELLQVDQPYDNHNGGHLAFGPDGLLYIGMGDGGAGGDPEDRAQEPDERLGKLLRIDVDGGGERGYSIPSGNLRGGAPEVWAVGLRNPWRFSFDSQTGDLWIGDVGQDSFEEVDALPAAAMDAGAGTPNFGWRQREGFSTFDDSGKAGPGERIDPVIAYGRDEGCSVTGGVVYRGRLVPDLVGWYVFSDFCGDDLRLVEADGIPGSQPKQGEVTWISAGGASQVASIAQVQQGELLVLSLDGSIRQVVPR